MSKQIKIGLDKTPAPVTKQFTQLIDIEGTKLFDSAGNPLVTEEETTLGITNDSANALSVFTNNDGDAPGIAGGAIPIIEQFPVESAVSSSLLGVPRSEEQVSLFADVATYGLDEDNWDYYIFSDATTPPEWYNKEHPVYGRRSRPTFNEGSNEQALYLRSFPTQYTYPFGPIENRTAVPSDNFIKYMRFVALGRYLFEKFKGLDLDFCKNNFLDGDKIDIVNQSEQVISDPSANGLAAYTPNFSISPIGFTSVSAWHDVIYKTDELQDAFDAIERWTAFYDKIRNSAVTFPILQGSVVTDYTKTDQYKAIRSFVSTRDYVLPGASSTWSNFAILESQKSFRYQPGRASGFTFGSRMDPGDPNSTANVVEWGCSNSTDEYMFQLKGSQFAIVRRSIIRMPDALLERQGLQASDQSSSKVFVPSIGNTNGLWETVIPRTKFNGDSLLGSGDSGYILSFDDVTMYKIEYSWYGAIGAKFYAYIPIGNDEARWVLLHTFVIENGLGEPVLANPDFKFKYMISSENTSDMKAPMYLYKYGSSYYVDGGDEGTVRLDTTSVDKKTFNTRTPILGILPKETISNSEGIALQNFKKSYPTTISVNSSVDAKVTIEEVNGSPLGVHFNFSPSIVMSGRHPDTRQLTFIYDSDSPSAEGITRVKIKQPEGTVYPLSENPTYPVTLRTGYQYVAIDDPIAVTPEQNITQNGHGGSVVPAAGWGQGTAGSPGSGKVYTYINSLDEYLGEVFSSSAIDIAADGTLTGIVGVNASIMFGIYDTSGTYAGRSAVKVLAGTNIPAGIYRVADGGSATSIKLINLDFTELTVSSQTAVSADKFLKHQRGINVVLSVRDGRGPAGSIDSGIKPQFYTMQTVPGTNEVRSKFYYGGATNNFTYNVSAIDGPYRLADVPPSNFTSILSVGDQIGFYGGGPIFSSEVWRVGQPPSSGTFSERIYTITEIVNDNFFRVDRMFPTSQTENGGIDTSTYWPEADFGGRGIDLSLPSGYAGFSIPVVRAFTPEEARGKIVADGIYGKYIDYDDTLDKQSTRLLKRNSDGLRNFSTTSARDSITSDGTRIEPDQTNPSAEFSAYVSALRTIVGSSSGINSDRFRIHFLIPIQYQGSGSFADWSVGVTPYKPTAPGDVTDFAGSQTSLKFLVDADNNEYKEFDYEEFPMCDWSHSAIYYDIKERAERNEYIPGYVKQFQVDPRYPRPTGGSSGYIAAIEGNVIVEDHKISTYQLITVGPYSGNLKIVFDSNSSTGPSDDDIKIRTNADGSIDYLSEVGLNYNGTGYMFTSAPQIDTDTGAAFIYAENTKAGTENTLAAELLSITNSTGTTPVIQTKLLKLSDAFDAQSKDSDGQNRFTNTTFIKNQAIRFSDSVLYPVFALGDSAMINGVVIEEISPSGSVTTFTPTFKTESGNTSLSIVSSGGSLDIRTPGAFNASSRLSSNRYDQQTLNPLRSGTNLYTFFVGANDPAQIELSDIFDTDRKAINRGLLNNKAIYITASSMKLLNGNPVDGEIELSVTIKEQ